MIASATSAASLVNGEPGSAVSVPAAELVEAQVRQFEKDLLYVQGKFEGVLEPGRHAFWNHPGARISVQVLDTRVQQLKVEGQELMTRDKVTLRLTLTAEYAPADAPTTVHAVADVKDAIYLAVQLAAREFVAGVTLDELYDRIYRSDVLYEAWNAVRRNQGSAGVDAQTIAEVEQYGVDRFLEELRDVLKNNEYRPQAVLRRYIPKADGKQRPLGIPTVWQPRPRRGHP